MKKDIDIQIKNKGKLLANANVKLETIEYGPINIKGFQIWQSSHLNTRLGRYINIKPPSQRYFLFLFFESQPYWEKLEKIIWQQYEIKVAENEPINIE